MLRENSSHLNVFTSPTSQTLFLSSQDKENVFQPQAQPLPTIDVSKMKDKLHVIFTFYASFGDRLNLKLLKSNKFHKMMNDANIKEGRLSQKRLDLLFMSESQHRPHIDFPSFLNLLIKVASFKYQVEDSLALRKILKEHFDPLYDNIMQMTDMGNEKTRFSLEMDQSLINILMEVNQTLSRIYLAYFPWEPKSFQQKSEIRKRSEANLMVFLKDFDICPSILTKSKCFLIFNEVIEMKDGEVRQYFQHEDVGTCFSFGRFLVFLCRVALSFENIEPGDAVRSLLERMELSSGFMNLEKKLNMSFTSKLSVNSSSMTAINNLAQSNKNNNNNIPNGESLMINNGEALNEEFEEPVRRVFNYYCAMGEPLNNKHLKSIKFKRFFKDCGLSLDQNFLDLVFIKLKGKSGKLEIGGFIQALTIISERIYPHPNGESHQPNENNASMSGSLICFIKTHILEFAQKINELTQENRPENYVQLLMDLLQDSEILDLLGTVHKSLRTYYEAYTSASTNGLMSFDGFAKFAKDFDIFPTILTKAKLLKIFETLAGVFEKTGAFHSANETKKYIDQHLFIEGLALCAFEVNYQEPEPSNFEKVYYFLEKLNQSEGVINIQKMKGIGGKTQNWDLLQEFRRKTVGNNSTASINRSRSSGVSGGMVFREKPDFDSLLRK